MPGSRPPSADYAGTRHRGGRLTTFYKIKRDNMPIFAHNNNLLPPRTSRGTSPQPSSQARAACRRHISGPVRLAGTIARVAAAVAATSTALAFGPTAAFAVAAQSGTGWVRFAHFAAGDGPVAVNIDGKALGDDIAFQDVTNFVAVPVGHQSVVVTAANGPPTPLAVGRVTIPAGGAITIAAVSASGTTIGVTKAQASSASLAAAHQKVAIRLQTYPDDLAQPEAGHSITRIINTFPSSQAITAELTKVKTTATLTVGPVLYGDASPYATVLIGKYNVVIKDGKSSPLVTGDNWPVPPGTVSSVVVIKGSAGPTLEVLVDAVGTSSTPKGSMQTGLGGTARKPLPLVRTVGLPVAAAGLVLCGGLYLISRRRCPAEPETGVN